jgi:RNA polymerase-associated protein LEO1
MADLFGELSSEDSDDGANPLKEDGETSENLTKDDIDEYEEDIEDSEHQKMDFRSTEEDDEEEEETVVTSGEEDKHDEGEVGETGEEREGTEENHAWLSKELASSDEEREDVVKRKLTSAQDLFGEDSTSSEGEQSQEKEETSAVNREDLFGEAGDISSDEEKRMETEVKELRRMGDEEEDSDNEMGLEGMQPPEEEGTSINVDIPRSIVDTGSDVYYVKLPNFLSVETRPFDPNLYEDEIGEDEVLDEEGRARLKLKVENTVRWRQVEDEYGNSVKESNAKIVKWSDGT